MRILVDGTTVTAWGDMQGTGFSFDVDDFPGVQEGKVLHWDGIRWWYEKDYAEPFEVLSALMQDTDVLDSLPDETLSRMAPYMAEWELGTAYSIGDMRQYGELPYRCLQDHTSQEGYEPDVAVSLWARILIPDPSVIPEWEQPSSTNPYMKGDKVTHNGKTWVSDIDYNVFEPGVAGWTEV